MTRYLRICRKMSGLNPYGSTEVIEIKSEEVSNEVIEDE